MRKILIVVAFFLSPVLGAKEYPPNCLEAPYAPTPAGQALGSQEIKGLINKGTFTFWRKKCSEQSSMIMLTIEPKSGSSVILIDGTISFVQGGFEFSTASYFGFSETGAPITNYTSYNYNIKTTIGMWPKHSVAKFKPNESFKVILPYGTDSKWEFLADPVKDNSDVSAVNFSGSLSGTWYDPKRSGEGALIELGETDGNKVLTFSWYTWDENNNGAQSWMIGTSEYKSGATEAKLGLFKGSGGKFGADFNSSQVKMNQWGEATLSFPACDTMKFAWKNMDGSKKGEYTYKRFFKQLDGVPCQ